MAHLERFVDHWVAIAVFFLDVGMTDGDALELDVGLHVRVVLAVGEGDLEVGCECGNRVLVPDAPEAEIDEERAADPVGEVVAGELIGVWVDFGLGHGDVVMRRRDGEAEGHRGNLRGRVGILGKYLGSIFRSTLGFCEKVVCVV